MIKLIKKFFLNFSKKSKKYKIAIFSSIALYIFLFCIVVIKVPYEIITPGAAGNALEGIQIGEELNTTNIYSLGIYTKKNITILEKWMGDFNKKLDLEPYDKSTDLSPEDYYQFGKTMMFVGNNNSVIIGYEKFLERKDPLIPSDVKLTKEYIGIIVTARFDYLNVGIRANDIITKINNVEITSINDLRNELEKLTTSDNGDLNVRFTVIRSYNTNDEFEIVVDHKVNYFKEDNIYKFKVGLGLEEFYTIEELFPDVLIQQTNSIGSSGSVMTALAIYEILSDKNVTKGYKIVGTGSLNHDGTVSPIGGIKQKIYTAAIKGYGFDIFFVPEENYIEALEAYNYIFKNSEPTFILKNISTFDDVLDFLDSQEEYNE